MDAAGVWATWVRKARDRTSIDRAFSPANSFGFLRLFFAFAVLVSHTFPLGYARADPLDLWTNGQVEIGSLSVVGFFVISGFLITRSGRRVTVGRFAWHRVLRILPAFWVCLLVTAFVVAPVVALIERGSLAGFWAAPDGPLQYVVNNWFIAVRQYEISGLLQTVPFARLSSDGVFDGSLWSLVYEVMCYVMVAGLAVVGVLRRARIAVLVAALAGFALMVYDLLNAAEIPGPQGFHGPVFGFNGLDWHDLIYLTYAFILGALIELYRERIWLNDVWAIGAAVVMLATMRFGGFPVLGYPAFAYLILWAAIRLPRRFQAVGRRHDYSYGFYIYAFPMQQLLVLVGVADWGMVTYIALCTLATLALAIPSWHLVERPAMSFKNWSPRADQQPWATLARLRPRLASVAAHRAGDRSAAPAVDRAAALVGASVVAEPTPVADPPVSPPRAD